MKLSAIILAGGKSSRMGTDKGLVLFNGKPMVEYLIEIFRSLNIPTIIVANNSEYNQFDVPVFEDLIKEKGPLAGIYTGLSHVESGMSVVVSCDIPCVSREMIETLVENVGSEKITIVSYKDRIHPLIGLYSTDLTNDLLKSLELNELRVRDFINSEDSKIIQLEDFNLNDTDKQVMNINTKEELNLIENGK